MVSTLRNLAVLELVNIPLFAFIIFDVLSVPPSPVNLAGFGLGTLLLVEGSAYWWAKVHQLRTRAPRPVGMAVFRFLRWVNAGLLLLAGAFIGWSLSDGILWTRVWPGVGMWLFAVGEHVNYFHLQLSHQTRADLRRLWRTGRPHRSHLARDMAR
ncbi:hypothetical protein KIK06_12975 [Nocardiopsis sp. EMB25]|uniref:hypothetical protein n=1 Tax=Nocardiopsis sp. EMB25 TaxID=2835867 RepID=UPI002283567B|nr:hypothetical protein [Nocardiopsis sp. EMB25]MCY9784803.1 hypothetical protein [Nocardiopsis sp. EMB25]